MMMPLIMMMMTMQEHDDYYEGVQVTEDTLPMDNYHCNIGKLKVVNFERAYFLAVYFLQEIRMILLNAQSPRISDKSSFEKKIRRKG